jgi:hypothetical protein
LGELDEKERGVTLEVFAPKFYRYFTSQGAEQIVCKGVPAEYQATYISNKEVEFQKAIGILEAIVRRLAPSEWVTAVRTMRMTNPKREYYHPRGAKEGVYMSHPYDVSSLPA